MRRISTLLVLLLLVPAAHAEGLDSARSKVEKIRGRAFKVPVVSRTIKREELRPFLVKSISKSVGTPAEYQRILETMQLVDADPKLIDKLLDLFDAQVLAFYDPETSTYYAFDEMPVSAPDVPLLQELVHVHELVHALQDQHFDLHKRSVALDLDFDRGHAYHALIEGEASLVMFAALAEGLGQTIDDMLANDEMMSAMAQLAATSPGTESAPRYFVESMMFPYIDGMSFVASAYKKGGWAAVDKLHEHPPISTEEILHPEKYHARVAVTTSPVMKGMGSKGESIFVTDVGEFMWRYLLGDDAGAGSDGGTFTIRHSPKGATSLIESKWDTPADAIEFEKAYAEFLRKRSLTPSTKRKGNTVRVAYGEDRKAIKAFVK